MNCSKCQYMKKITRNDNARCLKHGMGVLLQRLENKKLALQTAEVKELRRYK